MAAGGQLWMLCCCLLLATHLTDAGKGRKKGNGVKGFLSELQTVLDSRKTNMARMEGCGVDKVGAECERATADDDGPVRPDEKRIRAAMIPKSEREAVSSSGRIVNSDAEEEEPGERQIFLPPGATAAGGQSKATTRMLYSAAQGIGGSTSGASLARDAGGVSVAKAKKGPCRTRNGMFPHKNPTRYYHCTGGRYVVKKCAKGLAFDAKLQYCTPAKSPGLTGRSAAGAIQKGVATLAAKGQGAVADAVSSGTGNLLLQARNNIRKLQPSEQYIESNVQRAMKDRKRGCFCSVTPTRRPWEARYATVDQCWLEALRRGVRYLLVGTGGCQFWSSVAPLTMGSCTDAAYHIIDVTFFQKDLARLQPDMQFWVSARSPSDVIWGTVSNIAYKPLDIRGCGELCYKFGQDFARVDYRGCRCGMAGRQTVTIPQEDLAYLRRRQAALDPGFTVQLQPAGLADWECTAAPAHFVRVTAAESLQEALIACRERRFKFLTPGKDGFYCGNSTANLERFSRTQCQMNVTTTRAYSVLSIQAVERQIVMVENTVYDYVFWWVSSRSPGVFWTSLLGITQLEQCVLNCDRRFVAVGPEGCFCGSLRENVTNVHVNEWVVKSANAPHNPSQGYLMLDKRGFVNVPEGWHCTSEPEHWKIYSRMVFFDQCMKLCKDDKKEYAAFGRLGCLCGSSQDGQLRRLPMARCQDAGDDSKAYSLLSVDVWARNVATVTAQPEHQRVCWVGQRPDGVQWEVQPGANVLEQCVNTCNDQRGVSLIILGVNGCECGFGSPNVKTDKLCNPLVKNARVFLLVHRKQASKGYVPPKFEWIVKANLTKTDQDLNVSVQPWIKLTVKNTNQTRSRTIRGGFFVQTQSADQARTNGADFSSVVDGRNFSVTDVQEVTVITQNSSNLTRDGSVQGGQIGTADLTSQKLVQKERSEQDLKTSEQHNIKAGRNEISVNSVKDSNLTMDEELRDQLTVDGYKKQYVKGHRTTQTASSFTNDVDENAIRSTRVTSDMLKKDLLVNQTFGDSMSMDVRMNRQNNKINKATERNEGRSVILEIHVEGQCYDGPANWTGWTRDSAARGSPFTCLCSCLMVKKLFYAIYDGGNCFCSSEGGQFGNDMGVITTNGECPDGGRSVYDGMQHTQHLGRFCRGRQHTSIQQFLQKAQNQGNKVVQFKNSELMEAKINSSSIRGTHLNSTDTAAAKTVLRWHGKEGVTRDRWKSRFVKGPLRNLYGLRLHVHRRQDYIERMNLTTREHVRTTHSQRGVPFASGDAYTLRASSSSTASEQGGRLRLLSGGGGTTDTPTGRLVTTSRVSENNGDSGGPMSLLGTATKTVTEPLVKATDAVTNTATSLLRSAG